MNTIKPVIYGFCALCVILGCRALWQGRRPELATKYFVMAVLLKVITL